MFVTSTPLPLNLNNTPHKTTLKFHLSLRWRSKENSHMFLHKLYFCHKWLPLSNLTQKERLMCTATTETPKQDPQEHTHPRAGRELSFSWINESTHQPVLLPLTRGAWVWMTLCHFDSSWSSLLKYRQGSSFTWLPARWEGAPQATGGGVSPHPLPTDCLLPIFISYVLDYWNSA